MGLLLKVLLDMLLPQSANAPLSAQTILYTSIFEYLFLDGDMKRVTVAALVIMSLGIVLATLGANTIDGEYSLRDLFNLYERAISIIATAALAALVLTIREIARASSSTFSDVKGLIYMSVAAGAFSGWLGTATKSVAEVVKFAFLHGMNKEDAKHSGLWFLVLSLPLLGLPKLRFVALALMEFHPAQFLPLYQAASMAANAMGGIVYFNDFGTHRIDGTLVSLPLYLSGLVLTCLGTLMLSWRYDPSKHSLGSPSQDLEESRSLLGGWGGGNGLSVHADLEKFAGSPLNDGFGSKDAVTPRGKAGAGIFVKSASPHPPSTPVRGAGSRTPGTTTPVGTPGRYVRVNTGKVGTPKSHGHTPNGAGAATPSRRVVESALASAAAAAAQGGALTPSHRRHHSGAGLLGADDSPAGSGLRAIISPFEAERGRVSARGVPSAASASAAGVGAVAGAGAGAFAGAGAVSGPGARGMQALYEGSMAELDIDSKELVWRKA
jgi:hypothetical protein